MVTQKASSLNIVGAHLEKYQRGVGELYERQTERAEQPHDREGCLQRDVQEEHHRAAGAFSQLTRL